MVTMTQDKPPEYLANVTDPRQHAFLVAYPFYGSIVGTAEACGIPVGTCYRWVNPSGTTYKGMQEFHEGFEQAKKAFGDTLEKLAWSRVTDPTGNRGSDVLLLALLNANMPSKYRPNVVLTDDTAKQVLSELRSMARNKRRKPSVVAGAIEEAEGIVST